MNWLCPLSFWKDDCLAHGIMFWFIVIAGLNMLILSIIIKIAYNVQKEKKTARIKKTKIT